MDDCVFGQLCGRVGCFNCGAGTYDPDHDVLTPCLRVYLSVQIPVNMISGDAPPQCATVLRRLDEGSLQVKNWDTLKMVNFCSHILSGVLVFLGHSTIFWGVICFSPTS